MAEYLIQSETLTGIADAIRGKTGGTDPVAVSDMAAQIEGIQAGGGDGDIGQFAIGGIYIPTITETIKDSGIWEQMRSAGAELDSKEPWNTAGLLITMPWNSEYSMNADALLSLYVADNGNGGYALFYRGSSGQQIKYHATGVFGSTSYLFQAGATYYWVFMR